MLVTPFWGPASAAGPLRIAGSRMPVVLLLLLLVVGGCAGAGAGPAAEPTPPDAVDRTPSAAEMREARLAEVAAALEGGRFERAARMADSLYFRWRSSPELAPEAAEALWREAMALEGAGRPGDAAERLQELLDLGPEQDREREAVRRLARLHVDLGDDPAAVRLLIEHPGVLDPAVRDLARGATAAMSLPELTAIAEGLDEAHPLASIVRSARARARAEDGAATPVRIGAILPLTGRFSQVGSWLEEGIRLALQEREEEAGTPPVELEVLDDRSDPARARELMARLEGQGVVAVIGPVRSRALAEAGAARRDAGLLVVSPTATEMLRPAPSVYTLWDRERRETDAARVLGRWLGGAAGWRGTGALYPRTEVGREAFLAFRQGLERAGGFISVAASYPEGETTFEDPISTIGSFGPGSVFVMSQDAASLLQIAPQLSYYNVQAPIVAGGPDWSEPEIVRRLDPAVSQRRIVATFVDRTASEGPWADFKAAYERTYRKSLSDNMLPALSHDAMKLVLAAFPEQGPVRRRALARRFSALEGHAGATGAMRPDPGTGTVTRRIAVRMLEERRLVEVGSEVVRDWLQRSGAVEGVRLRRRQRTAREEVETRLRQLQQPREEAAPEEDRVPEPPRSRRPGPDPVEGSARRP